MRNCTSFFGLHFRFVLRSIQVDDLKKKIRGIDGRWVFVFRLIVRLIYEIPIRIFSVQHSVVSVRFTLEISANLISNKISL
jgi:hypothetical protein